MKLLIRATAMATTLLVLLTAAPVMAEGDAARGDAAKGQEKSSLCAACHGADGNSTVDMWPKLAGQHESYLTRQLNLIKSGARSVPEMMGITAMLSDEDILDLAAYFHEQASAPAIADLALVDAGERLYRAGNAKTQVPACMACHGPAGEGNPLAGYPALAGQHLVYTAKMLSGFKAGNNYGEDDSASNIMVGVASALSEAEIRAVASYIQGLYRKDAE